LRKFRFAKPSSHAVHGKVLVFSFPNTSSPEPEALSSLELDVVAANVSTLAGRN
jgi:hypothetical protein